MLRGRIREHACSIVAVCVTQAFTEKSLDFQQKIIDRSGLGDETYLPDGASQALHATVTLLRGTGTGCVRGGCQAHVCDFSL